MLESCIGSGFGSFDIGYSRIIEFSGGSTGECGEP